MIRCSWIQFVLCLFLCVSVTAQQLNSAAPVATGEGNNVPVETTKSSTLKKMTMPEKIEISRREVFPLFPTSDLNSDAVKKGQPVSFTLGVEKDLGNGILLPKGTLATGTIRKEHPHQGNRRGEIFISDLEMDLGNGETVVLKGGNLAYDQLVRGWYYTPAKIFILGLASVTALTVFPVGVVLSPACLISRFASSRSRSESWRKSPLCRATMEMLTGWIVAPVLINSLLADKPAPQNQRSETVISSGWLFRTHAIRIRSAKKKAKAAVPEPLKETSPGSQSTPPQP